MKKSLLLLKKTMMAMPIVFMCLLLSLNTNAQTVNPIVVKFLNTTTHKSVGEWYGHNPLTSADTANAAAAGHFVSSDSFTFHIQVTCGPKIIQTWYFGDTTIVLRPGKSAGPVQGHVFKYPGTYNVTLVVTDTVTGTANKATFVATTIGLNPPPVVVKPFHYGPYTSDSVATATLNSAASIPSGSIKKYLWTLTMGSGSNVNPSFNPLTVVRPYSSADSFSVNPGDAIKYAYISNDSAANPQIFFPQPAVGMQNDTIYTSLKVWGLTDSAFAQTSIQDTIVIPALVAVHTPTADAILFYDGATKVQDTIFTTDKFGCSNYFHIQANNASVPGTDSLNITWYFGDGSLSYTKGPHLPTTGDSLLTRAFYKVYSSPGRYPVYYVVTDLNTGLYATSPTLYLQDSTGFIPLPPAPTFTVNNITSDSITKFGYGYRFEKSYLTDSLAIVNLSATTYGKYNYVWSIAYTGTSAGIPAPLSSVSIPDPIDSASSVQLALTRPDSVLAGVSYPAYTAVTEPYTVTLTIKSIGCPVPKSTSVVIWDSLSDYATVGSNIVKGHVSTYPNPAVNNVTINTTLKKATSFVTVSVYDVTGKLRQESKVAASNKMANTTLNVANLSSGFYKVKVTNAEGQVIEVKSIFKN